MSKDIGVLVFMLGIIVGLTLAVIVTSNQPTWCESERMADRITDQYIEQCLGSVPFN